MGCWGEYFTDLFFKPFSSWWISCWQHTTKIWLKSWVLFQQEKWHTCQLSRSMRARHLAYGNSSRIATKGRWKVQIHHVHLHQTELGRNTNVQRLDRWYLVSLFKAKGLNSECDNHCNTKLLVAVSKVLARLLINRLMKQMCPLSPKSHNVVFVQEEVQWTW